MQHLNKNSPYSQLKEAFIECFAVDHNDSLHSLLYCCERDKDSVFKFLLRLKTRLDCQYDSQSRLVADLLRQRVLNSVDPQIRLNLHYETCSVDEFASHADRLLIRIRKTEGATILSPFNSVDDKKSNERSSNKLLKTRLGSLQRNVTLLIFY